MEIALGCRRVKPRQEDCAICCCRKPANFTFGSSSPND